MSWNTRAITVAAGAAATLAYTLCALAVALAPDQTTRLLSAVIHLDVTSVARPLTWGNFLSGLVFWWLFGAGLLGFMSWLYNRLIRGQTGAIRQAASAATRTEP